MKIIDGHALAGMIKKTADQRRDSGIYILAGLVTGFVNDMPEAEAYTEKCKRIENMEKIIEDQAERIAIMEADAPRWYPASMKPEKDDEDYYCLTKDDGIIPLRFLDGEWGIFAECFVGDACSGEEWVGIEKLKIDFGYWMPIPKPQKEGDQE